MEDAGHRRPGDPESHAQLKFGFDRSRPELVPHASIVYSASFPSGHTILSAVTYLTLGALLARGRNMGAMLLVRGNVAAGSRRCRGRHRYVNQCGRPHRAQISLRYYVSQRDGRRPEVPSY